MKAVGFEKVGAAPKVIDVPRPSPSRDQVLVKSVYTAINPIDTFTSQTGLLVEKWPLVVGVDAAGIVVELGDNVGDAFKIGDAFLMDKDVTILKPDNISLVQAATVGGGSLTACLALFKGLGLSLPPLDSIPTPRIPNKWLVVLGGASSVGKYAIQLARACGLNVVASCSEKSFEVVRFLGAHPFDYKETIEQQFEKVNSITEGNYGHIFDAAASNDGFARYAFKELNAGVPKTFVTTNDWSGIEDFGGGKTYHVELGPVGRPEAQQLNADIASYIPIVRALIKQESVIPNDYKLVDGVGFEAFIEALRYQQSGAAGSKKVVVQLQEQ